MGTGPESAVVDFDHRGFGVRDPFVADGAVVPSKLGGNQMITIMAIALRAGDVMADDLVARDRLAATPAPLVVDRRDPDRGRSLSYEAGAPIAGANQCAEAELRLT